MMRLSYSLYEGSDEGIHSSEEGEVTSVKASGGGCNMSGAGRQDIFFQLYFLLLFCLVCSSWPFFFKEGEKDVESLLNCAGNSTSFLTGRSSMEGDPQTHVLPHHHHHQPPQLQPPITATTTRNYYTENEDEKQIGRLASNLSSATIRTVESAGAAIETPLITTSLLPPQYDDDGNPTHPKLLERTISVSQQNRSPSRSYTRRKRPVKFDYPPVSSLRQCPCLNKEEVARMFFTKGELDHSANTTLMVVATGSLEKKTIMADLLYN